MDPQHTPDQPAVTPPSAPVTPVDDAALTPRQWLARNGLMLLLIAAALVLVWRHFGPEGFWPILKVVFGVGLIIFVHELGHFLVAKWCDVHVQTFSIGFGPALPGCSFRWGETLYKIALFPLGGYVKMVGEGAEGDEEDTDPRSYKNKSVGQRMAIISAGVVMNLLFGALCFILAFKGGVHQTAPVIGVVESGGPAWTKGVRTGDVVTRVAGIERPHFEDLKVEVMLSGDNESLPFGLQGPDGSEQLVRIEPRKLPNEPNPVIGVLWPFALKLPDRRDGEPLGGPVRKGSPAAAARVVDLRPGDRLLAATDPDAPDRLSNLPADAAGALAELTARFTRLAGTDVRLRVRRAGSDQEETVTLPAVGFEYGDSIVGTSDPDAADPLATRPLPPDPRDPQHRHLDYFELLSRLRRLEGRPMVVQVRRDDPAHAGSDHEPLPESSADQGAVNVLVPPAYHLVLPGVRMEMGRISAVREGSPAAEHGVKVRDLLTRVELASGKERVVFATAPAAGEQILDPLRLPFELRRWAAGREDVRATLTVKRASGNEEQKPLVLADLPWQSAWANDEELPLGFTAPLAIAELGLAYQVKTTIEDVAAGSPAAKAGLAAGDVILAVNVQRPGRKPGEPDTWPAKPVLDLRTTNEPSPDPAPAWAYVFRFLQGLSNPTIRLTVRPSAGESGADSLTEREVELTLQPDPTWPQHDPREPRGLFLGQPQDRIARAATLGEAVQMGLRHTTRTIKQIYQSLKSLVTRRVSATAHLQGPIDIAVIAYRVALRDWPDLVLLLGIISVNLAVVNFLPIPILDGGHMVFLIYEKLFGRPASESVRLAANWLGLLLLGFLMILVMYLGVVRHIL